MVGEERNNGSQFGSYWSILDEDDKGRIQGGGMRKKGNVGFRDGVTRFDQRVCVGGRTRVIESGRGDRKVDDGVIN